MRLGDGMIGVELMGLIQSRGGKNLLGVGIKKSPRGAFYIRCFYEGLSAAAEKGGWRGWSWGQGLTPVNLLEELEFYEFEG